MNREDNFLKIISKTLSDNSYIGSDCAYLEEFNLLVSHDTLIENIHFKLDYFTPYELGKKSALVNISDILAGGGKPKYMTVSLSGKLNEAFIENFYKGLNEICDLYEIKVIGGDLTGGEFIMVSICIIGVGLKNISSRKNAAPGDIVCIKGLSGSSAMGLKTLLKSDFDKENEFVKAHIEPKLYPNVAYEIAQNTTAPYVMMDTSDGLYDGLKRISNESSVGFEIEFEKIPKKINDKNLVLFGGEDFGLLICLKPKDSFLADKLNLHVIGKVTDSKKIIMDGLEIKEDKSFEHF